MSLGLLIILAALIIGGVLAIGIAVIAKYFGMDSFSMWDHDWFQKKNNDDKY